MVFILGLIIGIILGIWWVLHRLEKWNDVVE